ncbi:class I SAM-dependent methyltransferase [Amycolatopsis alkalitolerans]|uniref:Class I SAM-dependent methyltransferase n=1 Tax=Amycolatopsis alkalitolerans TaxID=2547244 RepID=A0A5C4LTA8_9PSEU|nr:class I SAM-dependent methyltransferase [Amycolatopsis alkalitolerans]TNC21019.1 class I SAM-dependent methyltransferase [Amycolatopsis alkalitolerans]
MHKTLHRFGQRHMFADGHSYDRRAGKAFRGLHRRVADDVTAAAPRGGLVLDAGCGTGLLAAQIANRRPDLRVRGVDLERGMIDVATGRAEREGIADRVEFTVADLADLPLPAGSVDLIVSTASMHHWADVPAVVSSLDRALRPEGQMWIYDIRWVPGGKVRAASARDGRRLTRTIVRAGSFPVALFQRLEVSAV